MMISNYWRVASLSHSLSLAPAVGSRTKGTRMISGAQARVEPREHSICEQGQGDSDGIPDRRHFLFNNRHN